MGAYIGVLTLVGYLGAACLSVAQLYDAKVGKWADLSGWVGFFAQTAFLFHRVGQSFVLPSTSLLLVWLAAGSYLILGRKSPWMPVGAFLFPVVFIVWLVGQWLMPPFTGVASDRSFSVGVFVALVVVSEVLFTWAVALGIMYTEKERELKAKRVRLFYYQLPDLAFMDRWLSRMMRAGWILLTVALLVGSVVFIRSSGLWSQSLSVLVWILYGIAVVLEWRIGWRGHRAAVTSMVLYLAVLANLLGNGAGFPSPHLLSY